MDHPATIGALPVAQAAGATVGYLPGLAMRRIADLHPAQAKNRRQGRSSLACRVVETEVSQNRER